MKRHRPESQLQKSIVRLLRLTAPCSTLAISIPNEGRRSLAGATELKNMGMTAGASDLVIVVNGHAHFLEVKTPIGIQSPSQIAFEAAAKAAGAEYELVRTFDEARALLIAWGALRGVA